jgi:hypothetical protein
MSAKTDNRDKERIIKAACSRGWTVRLTSNGWALKHPSGKSTFTHRAHGGSDPYSVKNFLKDIRRIEAEAAAA